MALKKETLSHNDVLLPNSGEQSEVRLQYQCSKNYLLAMLQDSPDSKQSYSRPPLRPSTSQYIQPMPPRPLQPNSVLMGVSGDGKRVLILPSTLTPQTQNKLPIPPITAPTGTNNGSEKTTPPKRPLEGEDSDDPNKTQEGDQAQKKKKDREMGPPCNCKLSFLSKKFHCNDFTEEDRKALFTDYWENHNWKQRKELVCSLIKFGIPNARRRACGDPSRKEFAFQYFLKKDGEMLRVCKVMFLATLSMGDSTVRDWVMCGMTEKPFVNL
ncbi:hypothetical protein JTE90_011654 [Oedothorax gibbosus]|uniref:Uncharacterized protein n=1 Tax=Oedothorax gibbosus TaxID=931172 RepID=A0AAV6U269_9ARAC|nr:hypothetical protein JTE90_011654 [Oedothorax gibbosus]